MVDDGDTRAMFELATLAAITVVAIVSTVLVTGRDGYRRIPRKH
jgi:hypothetical protein